MALLDRVKERCGSDLSDTELSSMIDAIVGELDARLRPVGPDTAELGDPDDPHSRFHRTLRGLPPIAAAAELPIVELDPAPSGAAEDDRTPAPSDSRPRPAPRTNTPPQGRPN